MNRKSSLPAIIFSLFLVGLLSACNTTAKPSGFLTSYEGFRKGPTGGVDKVWSHPGIHSVQDFREKLRPYRKIMLDPIWVSLSNKEVYDGINPQELQSLTKLLRNELVTTLGRAYPVVSNPGPDVLRLSIGLTGVESPSRILAATSTFMPIGLGISTVSKIVTGEHTNVGSASLELVASDSQSGESIFAAIDRRVAGKNLRKIADPLSDAKDAFNWWAGRLLLTLQSSR